MLFFDGTDFRIMKMSDNNIQRGTWSIKDKNNAIRFVFLFILKMVIFVMIDVMMRIH